MGTDSTDDDLRRLIGTFYVSFPAVCFVVCSNAILMDAVFFVPFFLSNRLHKTLRSAAAFCYVAFNTGLFSVLTGGTLYNCTTQDDMCTVRILHQRWCFAFVASSILFVLFFSLVDRVVEPLLRLPYRPYDHAVVARWQNAATVCILWVCISETDNVTVLLCMAVTMRRALGSWMPLMTRCLTIGFKTYMALITVYTLGIEECATVLKKDVVAASTLFAML